MDHATEDGAMGEARQRATYDDLIAVPDHLVAEIIDGELFTTPRPAPPHALACSGIASVVFDRFNGPPGGSAAAPGGWWILTEPELHLGDDVLVPDVAGWRRERLPRLPDVAYFTRAPDWACEVISPRSGQLDRSKKMRIYAREGVAHLWLVDPLARTLETYRLDAGRWVAEPPPAGGAPAHVAPFAAVGIEMRRWWAD
jgi:Uma2 family endonuclease